MDRNPDVEVVFEFNGARINPSLDGYRPGHLVKDDYLTTGVHHYYEVDSVAPNGMAKGTITFITPEFYPSCLWIGKKINIQEGKKIVGYATITKILNHILDINNTDNNKGENNMCNIDEIMNMLDWNNEEKVQNKGIEIARNIKCINVFLQPLHQGCSKNVWDNCAKILCEKTDDELEPYLTRLLEWLEDLNWPGALLILERLKKFDSHKLKFELEITVKRAHLENSINWLYNLSDLLENEKLKTIIHSEYIDIINKAKKEIEKYI